MIIQNRKLYVAQWDMTGHLSGVSCDIGIEPEDDTVLGDGARSSVAGLETLMIQEEGVWDAGSAGLPDDLAFTNKSLSDVLFSLAPVNGNDASVSYFGRTTQGLYTKGGAVGTLNRFSLKLQASGGYGAIRGTIMGTGSKSSTANGTKRQLGAVSASQKLYAALHVLSASGSSPTLDVTVRSDADSSSGSETTRITFAQAVAAGSQFATPVAGAITDTWWDVRWVLGGSSPVFDIVVEVGIQ